MQAKDALSSRLNVEKSDCKGGEGNACRVANMTRRRFSRFTTGEKSIDEHKCQNLEFVLLVALERAH
ncbi:MAG: hypothetical protein FJ215_03805 [Ignavibacteria bacterium]|nr:hypothetical protein [Ignavibacteria bacterium]